MMPPGLNEGEAKFVRDLRDYLQKNNERFRGKEIFLLRNLTRGKGIGFFDTKAGEAFYPDFILWVIEDNEQRIAFIDPHGLRMARGGFNDPKIRLYKELENLYSRRQRGLPSRKKTASASPAMGTPRKTARSGISRIRTASPRAMSLRISSSEAEIASDSSRSWASRPLRTASDASGCPRRRIISTCFSQ
jgi:hypothetical protein